MTTILEKTAGLVAFVRTVEARSFTKAARSIGSTPSAVSKSVARLERRLGVRLLQRSTRTVGLTAEGMAYYERVAPLLRAIEEAEDVVQRADGASGLLRVTASADLGRTLIAKLIKPFVDRYPKTRVELGLTERNVDLVREGYDLAIRMRDQPDAELVGRKLVDMRILIVAAPDYVARHGAPQTVDALRFHACLRYLLNGRPFPFTFANGAVHSPEGPFDSDDGGAVREAALSGAGIAYLLGFTVQHDIAAGRLVPLLQDHALPTMPLYVFHAYGRQLPLRARLFVDHLIEQIDAMAL